MATRLHDLSSEAVQRVERSRLRAIRRAARREFVTEVGVAGVFLAAAAALWLSSVGASPRVGVAGGLAVLYAVLKNIPFEVGEGRTHPVQLAFVPMLVLLPATEVPLTVAAAEVAAGVMKVARGQERLQRAVVWVADGSYSLAPALVYACLGPVDGELQTGALVMCAILALIASDAAISAFRMRIGLGVSPRGEIGGVAWLYVVDLLLAPVGLLAALAAQAQAVVVVLVLPLAGLLAIFAQERRGRIDNAMELRRLAQEGHDRLQAILQNSSDLIAIMDAEGRLSTVTGLAAPIFGPERDAGRGQRLLDRVYRDDVPSVAAFLAAAAAKPAGETQNGEWRMCYADGSYRHIEAVAVNLIDDGKVRGLVLTARDVEARKAFEEQLRHRAFHDALTGLANRALFYDRIEHALLRGPREATGAAVLFIDLDEFKPFNDTHGHAAGDRLLEEVAGRLVACLRSGDTAARLGGDEFGVLLEAIAGRDRVLQTATRVLDALARPYHVDDDVVRFSASVGAAISSPGDRGVDELLRKADLAMYKAKRAGRGRVELYNRALEGEQADTGRAAWFARADEQREEVASLLADPNMIGMVFQPIMDLRTGRVAGYESLMRVDREPRRGPDVWLAQAHRCGLGYALEARAITTALATPDRPPGPHLALNMSPSALTSTEVLRALPKDLHGIVIEITENELVSDDPALHEALRQLRERGAQLAVDDTGAGYAGLTHVMRLRPDIIKLDRTLITNVDSDPAKAALVASFVRYARDIDATVCAEGIETLSELERLADLDVAFGQGYAIARPGEPWPSAAQAARRSCQRSFEASVSDASTTVDGHDRGGLEQLTRQLANITTPEELDGCLPTIARELRADEVRIAADPTTAHAGHVLADAPDADRAAVAALRADGYHSSLSVPLVHRGATLGCLQAYRRAERPWSRFEVSRARLIAHQLGRVIHTSCTLPGPLPVYINHAR